MHDAEFVRLSRFVTKDCDILSEAVTSPRFVLLERLPSKSVISPRRFPTHKRMITDTLPTPLISGEFSELMFGFVGPIGANMKTAEDIIQTRCEELGYHVERVHVTYDILPKLDSGAFALSTSEFGRFKTLMDVGTTARRDVSEDIVALGIATQISHIRAKNSNRSRIAYIIHSLKHPAEVRRLRELYPRGFYLVAVNVPEHVRQAYLIEKYQLSPDEAAELMLRDELENDTYGQRVNDTFHLADFFVGWVEDEERVKQSLIRFVDIIFGDPHRTPTFSEYSMFMAFAAALRSADLSRQVGAVIARGGEILSTGANDCPQSGGGLYWPRYDAASKIFADIYKGRDYTRGGDSNRFAQLEIIKSITCACEKLKDEHGNRMISSEALKEIEKIIDKSSVGDLTEFGRVVHAEMEALLSCARKGISPKEATIYCTTFPCHNCAKHIIAAGIRRVVFIEPYRKSKATELHNEVIKIVYPRPGDSSIPDAAIVRFEPFFGVGPRRFFDLFSMNLGTGRVIQRKEKESGATAAWVDRTPRIRMSPHSYLHNEEEAAKRFSAVKK